MRRPIVLVLGVSFLGSILVTAALWWRGDQQSSNVLAATTGGTFPAALYLQATDGGMAQYGFRLEGSTSASATLQALADWNSYAVSRSEWGLGLTAPLLDRLAMADWNARLAGPPTITPGQLATAATNLINSKLATMTAGQQEQGLRSMTTELTPKGPFALNQEQSHASAMQNADGTWTVTISPEAFSVRKSWFATLSPGMVSSSSNFYPGEAMLIFYSLVSGDMGFSSEFVLAAKKSIGDLTGLDMNNRFLYGDNGYLFRRPLSTFLTEQPMSQLFLELGF